MPTIQEVVRDHRQHYLDRKLAKSPLLHFSPGSHRMDVCELFRGVQQNLPAAFVVRVAAATQDERISADVDDNRTHVCTACRIIREGRLHGAPRLAIPSPAD